MTPHNHAKPGDYAEAVLLPGDPLRAKWIAENFFEDARQVNSVRNCLRGRWRDSRRRWPLPTHRRCWPEWACSPRSATRWLAGPPGRR